MPAAARPVKRAFLPLRPRRGRIKCAEHPGQARTTQLKLNTERRRRATLIPAAATITGVSAQGPRESFFVFAPGKCSGEHSTAPRLGAWWLHVPRLRRGFFCCTPPGCWSMAWAAYHAGWFCTPPGEGGQARTTNLKHNAQNAGGVQHSCRPPRGR